MVAGSILGVLGLYPLLVDFAGFGAMLPISSFSNTVEGAKEGAASGGFWGIFTGLIKQVSAGVTAAVVFSFHRFGIQTQVLKL